MYIKKTKRSAGSVRSALKITEAIRKSFLSLGIEPAASELAALLTRVELRVTEETTSVEHIQDEVERALMEQGYYDVAKSYILYRHKRTELRKARQTILNLVLDPGLEPVLLQIQRDFDQDQYALTTLAGQFPASPSRTCPPKSCWTP